MEVPRIWRLKKQRYALEGSQCPDCKELYFPPRDICTRCSQEKAKEQSSLPAVRDVTIRA